MIKSDKEKNLTIKQEEELKIRDMDKKIDLKILNIWYPNMTNNMGYASNKLINIELDHEFHLQQVKKSSKVHNFSMNIENRRINIILSQSKRKYFCSLLGYLKNSMEILCLSGWKGKHQNISWYLPKITYILPQAYSNIHFSNFKITAK